MSEKQFATFYLDDSLFGIDILLVREINRQMEMTRVHKVNNDIRGLLNLRGQIITVLDLGIKLGLDPREITETSRCLVLKTQDEINVHGISEITNDSTGSDIVGLLVDRVGDVVTVQSNDIEKPPANIGEISGEFLNGVVKLEGELLSLLKVSAIVN